MGLIIFYKGGTEVSVVVEGHSNHYGVRNQHIRQPMFLWRVIQTHHCVINQIHDHADGCFYEIYHAPSHAQPLFYYLDLPLNLWQVFMLCCGVEGHSCDTLPQVFILFVH